MTSINNNEVQPLSSRKLEGFEVTSCKYIPLEDPTDVTRMYGLVGMEDESRIGFRSSPPHDKNSLGSNPIAKDRIFLARKCVSQLIFLGIVLLIVFQMVLLGAWIYLYNIFSLSNLKTFAWTALLSPFGAVPQNRLCEGCHSDDRGGEFNSGHSPPYVPIVGFCLTVLHIVIAATFASFQRCRSTFLFYMKQLLFVVGLFVIFSCALSGSLLYKNLQKLRDYMQEELVRFKLKDSTSSSAAGRQSLASSPLSSTWMNTQITNQCCGMTGWSDWSNVTTDAPSSCCYLNVCNDSTVYSRGCYALEYAAVLYYGSLLITTIMVVFIAGVVEYVLCRWYHQRKKETQAMVRATGHRVFMRQGSNFITFGGESRKYHVIRKDGVMIETRGALAASTSVNDHHISLEVLDFYPSDSISVTREVDRIVLSVTNKIESFDRGTAIITCMDDRNLEKIVVTPTANGIINVYT